MICCRTHSANLPTNLFPFCSQLPKPGQRGTHQFSYCFRDLQGYSLMNHEYLKQHTLAWKGSFLHIWDLRGVTRMFRIWPVHFLQHECPRRRAARLWCESNLEIGSGPWKRNASPSSPEENSSTQSKPRSNYICIQCIPYTGSSCRVLKTYLMEEYMSHTSQQQYIPLTPRRLVSHFSHHSFPQVALRLHKVWLLQGLAPWGCFCGYTTFGVSPIGCMCFCLMGWGQIGVRLLLWNRWVPSPHPSQWLMEVLMLQTMFLMDNYFGVHKVPAFKTLQLYLIVVWLVSPTAATRWLFFGGSRVEAAKQLTGQDLDADDSWASRVVDQVEYRFHNC